MSHWAKVVLILSHLIRRWPKIKSTLAQCLMLAVQQHRKWGFVKMSKFRLCSVCLWMTVNQGYQSGLDGFRWQGKHGGVLVPSCTLYWEIYNRWRPCPCKNTGHWPVLVQCWASVADAGSTLNQHWASVSCLLGCCLPGVNLYLGSFSNVRSSVFGSLGLGWCTTWSFTLLLRGTICCKGQHWYIDIWVPTTLILVIFRHDILHDVLQLETVHHIV